MKNNSILAGVRANNSNKTDFSPETSDSPLTPRPSPLSPRRGPRFDRRTTWERLSQIDDWIAAGTYPSTGMMALKLGVAKRTLTRDLHFMKTIRKLPIAYDERRYGFYYSKPVRGFPKAPLTEADIFAIMVAHKAVAQYQGTPFEKPLRAAFQKLTGQLDNRELHSIANPLLGRNDSVARPGKLKPTLPEAVIPQIRPPRNQSPNSTSNPDRPMVLPLLGERARVRANRNIRKARENLGDALSFRPIAPEDCDQRIFRTVSKALAERRELQCRYRNGGDKRVIPRRLQPYHLVCCDTRWYMLGYDVRCRSVRTFALARLCEPRMCRRRFVRPGRFDPDAYFKDSLGVMKGDGHKSYEVVIELDRFGTDLVRGRRWHPSQELDDLPDGCSRLSLRLSGLEEIERTILSWGVHATVIGPDLLRERLANIASELSARYADALQSSSSSFSFSSSNSPKTEKSTNAHELTPI